MPPGPGLLQADPSKGVFIMAKSKKRLDRGFGAEEAPPGGKKAKIFPKCDIQLSR